MTIFNMGSLVAGTLSVEEPVTRQNSTLTWDLSQRPWSSALEGSSALVSLTNAGMLLS